MPDGLIPANQLATRNLLGYMPIRAEYQQARAAIADVQFLNEGAGRLQYAPELVTRWIEVITKYDSLKLNTGMIEPKKNAALLGTLYVQNAIRPQDPLYGAAAVLKRKPFITTTRHYCVPYSQPPDWTCNMCQIITNDINVRMAIGATNTKRRLIYLNRDNRIIKYRWELHKFMMHTYLSRKFAQEGLVWDDYREDLISNTPRLEELPLNMLDILLRVNRPFYPPTLRTASDTLHPAYQVQHALNNYIGIVDLTQSIATIKRKLKQHFELL